MNIVTIADAIAVLDYLHKRELLCDKCGNNLALYEHVGAFHHRCKDCLSPHGRYQAYRAPNELERRICDALKRWNDENTPVVECAKQEAKVSAGKVPGEG